MLPENIPTTTDDDQLIAAAIPDSGKIAPDATPQDLRPHFGPLAAAEVALAEHAKAIRDLRKRVGEDINEIGQRLVECKRLLGHGNWLPWLQQQFGWSVATAERFIAVHKRLGAKIVNLTNLNIGVSSLYLLAAPSTPEDARIEVIERIGDGEPLTNAQVEEIVAEHKKPTRSPSRPPKSKAKKIRRAEPVVIEGMIRTAADNWSLALTQASAKERKDLLGALGQLLDAVGVDDSLKAMSPKYRTDLQGRHDRQQARVQGHLPTPKVETKSLAKRTVEQWANGGIQ